MGIKERLFKDESGNLIYIESIIRKRLWCVSEDDVARIKQHTIRMTVALFFLFLMTLGMAFAAVKPWWTALSFMILFSVLWFWYKWFFRRLAYYNHQLTRLALWKAVVSEQSMVTVLVTTALLMYVILMQWPKLDYTPMPYRALFAGAYSLSGLMQLIYVLAYFKFIYKKN